MAMLFITLFIAIIAAPIVIVTIDDTIDVTFFFGENEEEETENLKLHFDSPELETENSEIVKSFLNEERYLFKSYQKPYQNVPIPPPDCI